MLTCMGEPEPLSNRPHTRLLRIDCANNPDNEVKKAVASLLTHHDVPSHAALPPVYILAVVQPPPVVLGHVTSQVEHQRKLARAKANLSHAKENS